MSFGTKNVQFKSPEEQMLETTLANPVLQIPKEVVVCFDEYQKARIEFVVNTDALAQLPNNIPSTCKLLDATNHNAKPKILTNIELKLKFNITFSNGKRGHCGASKTNVNGPCANSAKLCNYGNGSHGLCKHINCRNDIQRRHAVAFKYDDAAVPCKLQLNHSHEIIAV